MPTPLALDTSALRAGAALVSPQTPVLRLPAAAWSALLSALALDPQEASLPGTASVLARAPGNSYQIEYAGRIASFPWPQPLAAGTVLHLVRATAPALPAAAAAPADSALVGDAIPALARLLDGALRDPPAPLALRLETPPAQAPHAPAAPQRFAAALAEAVSGSGVFFESHLADWARGGRDSAPIFVEAQARVGALAIAPEATGEAAFRQQLASLVTGELAFQFAAWPGQNATLAIGREPEQAPPAAVPERGFVAHLELAMPELGSVRATLNLNPRGIDIDVSTATAASARALRAARDSLVQALAAAQLQAGRIEVSHEQS